jgi:hypothetical protein
MVAGIQKDAALVLDLSESRKDVALEERNRMSARAGLSKAQWSSGCGACPLVGQGRLRLFCSTRAGKGITFLALRRRAVDPITVRGGLNHPSTCYQLYCKERPSGWQVDINSAARILQTATRGIASLHRETIKLLSAICQVSGKWLPLNNSPVNQRPCVGKPRAHPAIIMISCFWAVIIQL